MKKLNKSKTLLVVLSSALLLTGCNSASVKLKNPDDPVVVDKNGNNIEVDSNKLKKIFDQIKNSSGNTFASDIAKLLIEELAKSYIGDYKLNSKGELEIEGLDLSSDDSVYEFVSSHKFYWDWKSTGVSVVYEEEPSKSNISSYRERIQTYLDLVEKQIVKELYSSANTTSYVKNSRFYEVLFAKNLYSSLYPIYDANGNTIGSDVLFEVPDYKNKTNEDLFVKNGFTFGKLIDASYNVDDDYKMIVEGDTALLHLYHYVDYVNESVIPTIINNLLTQAYIYQKQYQSIGRTQSRKLNFITLSDSSSIYAETMLKTFVQEYLSKETSSDVDFTPVVEAWYGIHSELNTSDSSLDSDIKEKAHYLAETTFGTESTVIDSKFKSYIDGKTGEDYPYYDGSVYGDLIKKYSKLTNNPSTNDSSAYSNFTSIDSINYSPEEGLALQIENIKTTKYVTNKWGGSDNFSALTDSTMTNKLFSYGLSSEFETATNPNTSFIVDGSYLKQFVKNGPTFLKKTTYTNQYDSIVWKSNNTYFIIEVVDQISPDVLASGTDATKDELKEIENNAIDMGYTLASGTTFTSNAVIYFLKQSNINYYDQTVYDYFKSTYPALFE